MELVKETIDVSRIVCKGSVQLPVDEDIIVPDIKPDILKILQMDAVSCVTDKETENGRVTVNGRVDFKILYIPDSDSEKIKSIAVSFDVAQNVDSQDITDSMNVRVAANVEKAEFSLINSRKLRVRAQVAFDYEIASEEAIEIATEAADEEKTELLRENLRLQNCVGLSEAEFSVRDSIEVPNGQISICEVLKVDARVCDSEYKTVTGKIVAKGTVTACVLYTDNEGSIRFMETEMPFTEVFDCTEAGDETICDIDYSITDIKYEVCEDNDGDSRIVELDIAVNAQIKATENMSFDVICDCYEPYMNTQLVKEETEMEEVVSRPSSQSTIREMLAVASGTLSVSGVYDVIARPYITKAQLQRGKLLAEGRIEVYVLYLTDSAESPVSSMKKEIPFSTMLDCDAVGDDLVPEIKAEIKHTAYNLNVAGEIELRCILLLNANVIRRRKIELISDAMSEEREKESGIVIYFVQKGDTLWSVSKRYAVPREEIVKFNNLSETDNLSCGTRLFIPVM